PFALRGVIDLLELLRGGAFGRVACAAVAEERWDGASTAFGLGVGHLLDGFGDLVVQAFAEQVQGRRELPFDELADRVALDGLGDALVDERFGVRLVHIDALAGGLAEIGFLELDEHQWVSWVSVGVLTARLQASQGWRSQAGWQKGPYTFVRSTLRAVP